MARRKKVSYKGKSRRKADDKLLMLLAACAALIVGFFAIFSYRSQSIMALPTPTPNQIITVDLTAQNGSGEYGTATLQEVNGKVVVTLNLLGFPKGVTQPAHIHLGACPNPGAVKYPLNSVVNGQSVTTIDTTLVNLVALKPIVVNVHKSVAQSSIYYSCGNIK